MATALPFWLAGLVAGASELVRTLPPFYRAGNALEVRLEARPDGPVQAYGIEESVPPGWSVGDVSHDGVYDPVAAKVRWGPFFDGADRDLVFDITPPAGSTGPRTFLGTGQFGADTVPASGSTEIAPAPSAITSSLPAEAVPGTGFDVFLAVAPAEGVQAYSVTEQVPVGWVVSGISQGGGWDGASGSVKWGPFTDGAVRTLQYRVAVPVSARGAATFSGGGVFDRTAVDARGSRTVQVRDHRLTRVMGPAYLPGIPVDVQIHVEPLPSVTVYSVEEQLPSGWTATGITGSGSFDAARGRIKWGPIEGAAARDLGYRLVPSLLADADVVLSGMGVFDSQPVDVLGATELRIVRNAVERGLPERFQPGVPFTVSVTVSPRASASVWAVEETVPTGWTVDQVSNGGVFDAPRSRVKWREFDVSGVRVLTYRARPPASAVGEFAFDGIGVFDLETVGIGGDAVTRSGSRIVREVDPVFRPGLALAVVLDVVPLPGTVAQSVEENVPEGWDVVEIGGGGVFDAGQRRVKWGPFTDAQTRRLTVSLRAPVSGPDEVVLGGQGVFDGVTVATEGPTALTRRANRAPVAFDDRFQRPANSGVRLRIEAPLANDVDPDSSVLGLLLPEPVTERGGRVVLEDGWIVYAPPTVGADPVEDAFLYFVTDDQGGRDLGRVVLSTGNLPPVLAPVGNRTVAEGSLLAVTLEGTDPDLPAQPLAYSLVVGPAGMVVTPGGALTWTPTEAQGPGTNAVTVRVSDGALNAQQTFTVVVTEVNEPPVLAPVGDRTVAEGSLLEVTLQGTDPDLPAQSLVYSLVTGPAGMVVTAGGALTWTPTEAQGPGTFPVTVRVGDGALGAEQSFTVVVTEDQNPPAGPATLLVPRWDGSAWVLEFTGTPGGRYRIESAPFLGNPPGWTLLETVVAGPDGRGVYRDTSPEGGFRFYRAVAVGGGTPAAAPILLTPSWDGSAWVVEFTGTPGGSYRIESAEALVPSAGWTSLATVVAGPDGRGRYRDATPSAGFRLYRAIGLGGGVPPAPELGMPSEVAGLWIIPFTGSPGVTYRVEGAAALGTPTAWVLLGTVTADGDGSGTFLDETAPAGGRLYRFVVTP